MVKSLFRNCNRKLYLDVKYMMHIDKGMHLPLEIFFGDVEASSEAKNIILVALHEVANILFIVNKKD